MDEADAASKTTVRIGYRLTSDEAAVYQKVSERRTTVFRESWAGDWVMMFVVAVLAVAAGLVCVAYGIVRDVYNPVVPLLCGATYYIAQPIRERLAQKYHRKTRATSIARFVDRDYETVIGPSGITQRLGHFMVSYDWLGIEQVTVGEGLIFLWTTEKQAMVVPLRAIPEADRVRTIDLAKARGYKKPSATDANAFTH